MAPSISRLPSTPATSLAVPFTTMYAVAQLRFPLTKARLRWARSLNQLLLGWVQSRLVNSPPPPHPHPRPYPLAVFRGRCSERETGARVAHSSRAMPINVKSFTLPDVRAGSWTAVLLSVSQFCSAIPAFRITERHYSPWARARQEQLERDVRASWALSSSASEGTSEVHGGSGRRPDSIESRKNGGGRGIRLPSFLPSCGDFYT